MEKLKDLKPRSIGPAGMSGRVTAIDVANDNPDVIYVGTASGGIWKSESGGVDWKPVFDNAQVQSIGAIRIDPTNASVVWAGTGEGNPRNSLNNGYGVYKSLDAGRTWKLMGLEKTRYIHRIVVDPANPDVVYVGAIGSPWGPHPERGVYKTTDGGKSWKQILFTNETSGVADMVMDPFNPNKLIVAMWDHQRWPWFFRSGGNGSGLYMTHDGGESWQQLTEKDGLPKGELGRIGLAIARSDPRVVYAIIEAEKNALYRSDDGGFSWEMAGDQNIGDRPFYYSEIYVDPANENRVYTLFSRVNVSEDGGKSFSQLLGWQIHPDHHAWWISPTDPDYMINGNDGGMAITRDRGKTWQFVENLPVGQFYHIRTDMETPYHIYGGLQDNGSWRGPAYTWTSDGILNDYWDNLYGGDGFDVVPDASDPRYCYAMSQGGSVGRVDLLTGATKSIQPVHPDGIELRFNWNAAIAPDPFDPKTIYFGSQFLHKSTDRGESWEIISPDLTTNDPAKQKYGESGGLTYDVTGAENYTTIIAIAPSPARQGVIWVGTDDGNVQLTTDGGKNWTNLTPAIREMPKGSWIPMIHASNRNPGEAFVVANNYRQNDWKPYLFHTTDFGKKWTRLADESDFQGYTLSVVQDPVEPRLIFLGTERGLYFSLDYGETWTKWTEGIPNVNVMDLAIQPRENDLVIGTFGRSIYVLDDIRPLRAMATAGKSLLDQTVKAYDPPVAWVVNYKSAPGMFAPGNANYSGEDRPRGAMITYSVKEGNPEQPESSRRSFGGRSYGGFRGMGDMPERPRGDQAKIRIYDSEGSLLRTLSHTPVSGMNRLYWSLDMKGFNFPGRTMSRPGAPEMGGGGTVLPGDYKLVFEYKGKKDSTMLTVKWDPRTPVSPDVIRKNRESLKPVIARVEELASAMEKIQKAENDMQTINKLIPKKETEQVKALKKAGKEVADTLKAINSVLEQDRNIKGIYRDPKVITRDLYQIRSLVDETDPLNETQLLRLEQVSKKLDDVMNRIKRFFDEQWPAYQKTVEEADLSLFPEEAPPRNR